MINSALRILKSESNIHSSELKHTANISESSLNPIKHDYEVLLQAIEQLPNGFRTVFYLHAIDGLSHKEIGEHLGISEGTSKSQYARARKRLQNELKHLYPEFPADI
jgi:RNA polymerase sigma-70 factor (ECF subfamily)